MKKKHCFINPQYLSILKNQELKKLCDLARYLDKRNAIPATSSNFSMRFSTETFLISRSGFHKRNLRTDDFINVNLEGKPNFFMASKPSDETLLHALIYKLFPDAQFVAHTHAKEFDEFKSTQALFSNHELIKAFGYSTHESSFSFPIFPNNQDIKLLADRIAPEIINTIHKKNIFVGFGLERHGIYCFGKTVEQVQNYLEALMYLSNLVGTP